MIFFLFRTISSLVQVGYLHIVIKQSGKMTNNYKLYLIFVYLKKVPTQWCWYGLKFGSDKVSALKISLRSSTHMCQFDLNVCVSLWLSPTLKRSNLAQCDTTLVSSTLQFSVGDTESCVMIDTGTFSEILPKLSWCEAKAVSQSIYLWLFQCG